MKRIIVIALYKEISQYYKKHLESILGDLVEIESTYIENNSNELDLDGDLILTSSTILYDHIKRINTNNIVSLVMGRTFTKEGYNKLKKIDKNVEMLMVSNFYEIAVECVSKLYELGIKNIKLVPYNGMLPHNDETKDISTVVIAGDTHDVPEFATHVIDIGDRVIDLSTLADIGSILKLPTKPLYESLNKYKESIMYTDYGFSQVLSESFDIKKQLKTILSYTNDSIIATDLNGCITEFNDSSERIYEIQKNQVMGTNIDRLFYEMNVKDVISNKKTITNELININHIAYVINKYPMLNNENKIIGVLIISRKYMEIENEQSKLRLKLVPKGHIAKYNMESILGKSKVVQDLKKIAVKMAKSSSTILITGESGTGKEVFAQAIHNASERKNKGFIAVNCSAIAPSLLESELFGYEEGAFTGAKKGGKIGLFEMANGGTIFLDEIGELPYELQAKLLRVLMEREIMRIGGTNIIKIDVRVIAATNKDLLNLIAKNAFREDLYYRLNVLPLHLPPLRERKEDIEVLALDFLKTFGDDKIITHRIMDILQTYDWPGNVRELHNCVEYMYQLSDERIQQKDIPMNIRQNDQKKEICKNDSLSSNENIILKILYKAQINNEIVGRKKLHYKLIEYGINIPEQDIRFILKRLSDLGLVTISQGRSGSKITDHAIKALRLDAKDF
ncbi:MAG: sigma 54-interacting transcriptional regulator [Lachnospiraceae bacterium]